MAPREIAISARRSTYALQAAKTGIILFCFQSVGMGCAVFCGLKKPCGELQFGWQKRKKKEIDTVSSFPPPQTTIT